MLVFEDKKQDVMLCWYQHFARSSASKNRQIKIFYFLDSKMHFFGG